MFKIYFFFGKLGLKFVFWESISSHTHAFVLLYSMLWGKISKIQVFFSQKLFFPEFRLIQSNFDQSKSYFKNYVSLYLVRLIKPVFRSIEDRISGFLKTDSLTVSKHLFQQFFNFSSLSDLARLHYNFFVVFLQNFCKVLLPQGR